MKYRAYLPADRADCLAIFDSNAPRFFASTDRPEFEKFLDNPPGFFGVLCNAAGNIVACGGVRLQEDGTTAVLTWGMVHADRQRQGIGKALARARLQKLADFPGVDKVVTHTIHETVEFYLKLGFSLKTKVPDGYRKGVDLCELETSVDEAFWQRLIEKQ